MRNRRSINWVATLTIFGASVFWYFATHELPPALDRPRHRAIGRAMAQEALRHLKPGGTLSVIARDTGAFKHPETDLQLRGFQDALRNTGTAIATFLGLQLDPLRPLAVPPGDFFELIRRSAPGSVIVSFMGPPVLDPEQRARLPEARPAIVAFCPGPIPSRIDLRELFEAQLLHAAAIGRPAQPAGSNRHRSPEESFDAAFRFVRAGDVASLDAFRTDPP